MNDKDRFCIFILLAFNLIGIGVILDRLDKADRLTITKEVTSCRVP